MRIRGVTSQGGALSPYNLTHVCSPSSLQLKQARSAIVVRQNHTARAVCRIWSAAKGFGRFERSTSSSPTIRPRPSVSTSVPRRRSRLAPLRHRVSAAVLDRDVASANRLSHPLAFGQKTPS